MDDLNWYALYTKSRHEKFVTSELEKRNIEPFLPTRKIKSRWSDRTITIEEPLFKSYAFVKTDPVRRKTDILRIKGVVRFVSAGSTPLSVDETVILSLKKIVQQDLAIDPFPYLEEGDRVYVKSGLFKGVEGYIVRKDGDRCRLVISIQAIRSSISIEVGSSLVEKL